MIVSKEQACKGGGKVRKAMLKERWCGVITCEEAAITDGGVD